MKPTLFLSVIFLCSLGAEAFDDGNGGVELFTQELLWKLYNRLEQMYAESNSRVDALTNEVQQLKKSLEDLASLSESKCIATPPVDCPTDGVFRSCSEAPNRSGVYKFSVQNSTFEAFCEQEIFGGHWMVIQRRMDGSENFNRSKVEYRNGFGAVGGEFWLGLENMHLLTSLDHYELLVVMENYTGASVHQIYNDFRVEEEADGYRIRLAPGSTGTAGDGLSVYANERFSTYDSAWNYVCVLMHGGGFWHYGCGTFRGRSNLNGIYGNRPGDIQTIWWGNFNNGNDFDNPLKRVQMMIRKTAK